MQVADVETVRAVRREMSRHCFDASEVSIHAGHGIVHINGRVRPLKGHEAEFEVEIRKFTRIVRQRTGIRDLITEWFADGYDISETSKTRSNT